MSDFVVIENGSKDMKVINDAVTFYRSWFEDLKGIDWPASEIQRIKKSLKEIDRTASRLGLAKDED